MIKHISALLLLSFFIFYNFFYTGRYAEYPWWHEHGNDIDAAHAATTIGLLNNSELTFVYHPAATIYALHGIAYRMLALKDPAHQRLLYLREVKDYNQAADLLETSTRTSRILTVIEAVLFLIVFYFLMVQMGGNCVIAFLVTFYLGTSHAFLQHICMVRAEILNMIFFLSALYLVFHLFQKKIEPSALWARFVIPCGIFLGLSVFSKIQIGPVALGFLGLTIFYLLWLHSCEQKEMPAKIFWFNFGLSLINLLVMPWQALKRPAFLTPEVFSVHMPLGSDWRKVYGPAPESFFLSIFVFLMILAVMSACLIGYNQMAKSNKLSPLRRGSLVVRQAHHTSNHAEQSRSTQGVVSGVEPPKAIFSRQFIRILWFSNLLIFGAILSIYMILSPVSVSFPQYVENTGRLVYAVLTNVTYGGFLSHRVMNFETWENIWNMHAKESHLAHMNVLYFVILVSMASLYRFFRKDSLNRWFYGLTLFLFATGLVMDVFATMRSVRLYHYYAIYSLSFWALGLGLWLSLGCRKMSSVILRKAGMLVLAAHALMMSFYLLSCPRASGKSDQDPRREYINTRSHAAPFWRIVDESIEKDR